MSELDPAINADIGDDWFEIIEGVKIMAASARGGHKFLPLSTIIFSTTISSRLHFPMSTFICRMATSFAPMSVL